MKRKLDGLIRLARYKEYLFFVIVTTLLGAAAANGVFGWKLAGVVVANQLAVAFAFMINDVEDAPDDALTPAKAKRNPVSAADISAREARYFSLTVAGISALTFSLLGFWPFICGFASLALGFLYSWRGVRFKNMPVLDFLTHCMMLAGLQFLSAFFVFSPYSNGNWFFPFLFVVCISGYGELFNEVRDLEGDRLAGLVHTASLLGRRNTSILMYLLFTLGAISAILTILLAHLIPNWVLFWMAGLAFLFTIPPAVRVVKSRDVISSQESFQKPLEIAAAFALMIQFIVPWATPFFNSLATLYLGFLNFIG
ncbi:MAG TPA: UbiA family prenyltransferase [Longilinea sp.]|nr:UbiA family prenyltransferase [Longilinea sp.]